MIHLEPSIKTEFSESALRFEPRTEHVSTLFSPPTINHHLLEVSNDALRLPSPMQRQPSSPSHRSTNPMSVSSLCSPASSMPPHFAARGVTQSPSSKTSTLSSPPNSPHTRATPASPRIEVLPSPALDSAQRQFSSESSSARPQPQPQSHSHSQMRQQSTPLALITDDHVGQEYDERTKTWKNATGFRRDLTADKLTQPDAPTRRKRPATTVRRGSAAVSSSAAASATPGPAPVRARHAAPPVSSASQHSGSGESFAEDDDDELASELLGEDRIASFTPTHQPTPSGKKRKISERAASSTVDPGTPAPADALDDEARLEKKRRQNTQAARRSRIRKAEEVQKLQTRVATLEAELEARNTRLAAARRDAASAHALHRAEVEFGGVLKNTIVDLVGEARGAEAIARAKQRWRAMCPPPRSSDEGSDSNEKEKENYGHGAAQPMDLDYDADYDSKTGARGGS